MSILKALSGAVFGGVKLPRAQFQGGAKSAGMWNVKCIRPDGSLRWEDDFHNLVVNEGRNYSLDVALGGGAQDTTWFVGLLVATPSPALSWTLSDINANDFINYDQSVLQAFVDGGTSISADVATMSNAASKAVFTISADSSSIGGAYLITDNVKGTAAGTLYSAGAFTEGNKAANDDDTLQVTCTFTQADDEV